MTPRRRLAWFAASCFVILFGIGEFVRYIGESMTGPSWWGIDLQLIVDAGARLSGGANLYDDPKFLYPPLAAVVGVPLASLDFLGISIFYAVVKVVLAAAAVLVLSPGVAAGPRVLATLTLVGSLPFVHDVLLGNANVVLVAAMVPALLLAPRMRSGILLGIVAAIFAKPLLAPVLLWLLVWRRPVLGGALVGGLGATGLGVLLAGPANYLDWFWALVGGSRYAAPFVGNHGVSALLPDLWLPVAVVTAIALLWVLARSGPQTGLTWAAASGILLAPYAGTYSALPIALAVPGMLRSSPTAALLIVALSPIATTHPLPFYAAAILLLALRSREARRPGVAAA